MKNRYLHLLSIRGSVILSLLLLIQLSNSRWAVAQSFFTRGSLVDWNQTALRSAEEDAQAAKYLRLSYCGRQEKPITTTYLEATTDAEYVVACADMYPLLANYMGDQMVGICVFVPEGAPSTMTAFVKETSLIRQPMSSKTVRLHPGWNTVMFDQPYTITDNITLPADGKKHLYVGYMGAVKKGEKLANDWNDETPTPYAGILAFMPMSTDLGPEGVRFLIQALIKCDASKSINRVEVNDVLVPSDLKKTEAPRLRLSVYNAGTNVVNSVKVRVSGYKDIEREIAFSTPLEANAVQEVDFDFEIPANTDRDVYDLTAATTSVNGVSYPGREIKRKMKYAVEEGTVPDADKMYRRNPLLELFTTAECGNCPAAHAALVNRMAADKDVYERTVKVAHHSGFGTDEFTRQWDLDMLRFFNGYRGWSPSMTIDRYTNAKYNNPNDGSPFVSTYGSAVEILKERLSDLSFARINVVKVEDTNVVVEGQVSMRYPADRDVRLTVYVMADLYGYQSGAGSNYLHQNVIVDAPTGRLGAVLDRNAEGGFKLILPLSNSPQIAELLKKEEYKIALVLHRYDSNLLTAALLDSKQAKPQNGEVLNAAIYVPGKAFVPVEAVDVSADGHVFASDAVCQIEVNGRDILIVGAYASARVYGMDGSICPLVGLSTGAYIVEVVGIDGRVMLVKVFVP